MIKMNITLIQMESDGTKLENKEKSFKFLNEALKEEPDIICLSELFLSWGKNFDDGKVTIDDINDYQTFARKNNVNLILGSVALISNVAGKTTNSCFIIDRNGNIVGRYDKKYMYTVNKENFKFAESDDTIPGKEIGFIELDNVKIGVGICFDLRFPEYFRELTKMGIKIIFLPSHFREDTGKVAWEILTKARAIENQVYFCACNQTGKNVCGNSKIIDYQGKVIKEMGKEEGLLTVNVDLSSQERYRQELPILEQIKNKVFNDDDNERHNKGGEIQL